MASVLCIGLGGLGVIAASTLQRNGANVTAVIRSDYERVKESGYTVNSLDENESFNYVPTQFFKSLDDVGGPFDFIVVTTKVIPGTSNVWDQVAERADQLLKGDGTTGVVLIENGIGLEADWRALADRVVLISGTSYISSTNVKGVVTQYGTDNVKFGLFQGYKKHPEVLFKFIELYTTKNNKVHRDENVQLSRWKKLLYNAVYNTTCCLVNLDVGKLYELKDRGIVDNLVKPLMREVKYVANQDLEAHGSSQRVTDADIDQMEMLTEKFDVPNFYAPSMLVDSRNHRPIELEVIVGNILRIYRETGGRDAHRDIPYLSLMYQQLLLVQHRLQTT
ncbi:hypothetical protein DICA3_D17326 [Diutina catenulata]